LIGVQSGFGGRVVQTVRLSVFVLATLMTIVTSLPAGAATLVHVYKGQMSQSKRI
jgi:hypothetical protein